MINYGMNGGIGTPGAHGFHNGAFMMPQHGGSMFMGQPTTNM